MFALIVGFGFETSYTAPLSSNGSVSVGSNAHATAPPVTEPPKVRVAICVVLIDGHIKAHKAFGADDVKNAIDAEAFVDSVGVLRHAFDSLAVRVGD